MHKHFATVIAERKNQSETRGRLDMSTLNWPQGRPVKIAPRSNQPSISLTVHETGEGPAVVFCHGFPELAYSWRHQLPAVAAAGFRAIAPDQRGYAESSAPAAVTDYGLTELTGDMAGLLDELKIERADFRRTRLGRLRRVGDAGAVSGTDCGRRRSMHAVHGDPADLGHARDGQRKRRTHVHPVVPGTRPGGKRDGSPSAPDLRSPDARAGRARRSRQAHDGER